MNAQITYDRDWTWLDFPQKPEETARQAVKALGFRWSVKRNAWYAPRKVEPAELAVIGEAQPEAPKPAEPHQAPNKPAPSTQSEADKAHAWIESLDLGTMQKDQTHTAEFYKYSVSVYFTGERFYLVTKSPQQKAWRRTLGTDYARGTKEEVYSGMDRFIRDMEAKRNRAQALKEAKREARAKFENPYKVGSFLYSSWGYDQTNREFYQVLEVRDLALKIREVAQSRESTGYDCGTCTPIKDKFIEPARWVTIQVDARGYHSVPSPIHGNLYAWEGKPVYWSSYA